MRRYSSGVPFWGIRVPKIEATARTIKRGIVSRTEDRAAQREGKNPFSFSVDNGYLRTKKQFSLAEAAENAGTAKPQPKNLYWTQMNTDKHRLNIGNKPKVKRLNGTRMNTDQHG